MCACVHARERVGERMGWRAGAYARPQARSRAHVYVRVCDSVQWRVCVCVCPRQGVRVFVSVSWVHRLYMVIRVVRV